MELVESAINDNLIYSSPRIFERRRRILEETRHLIAQHGYEGFRIRELCQRAGVAPQTVYKAFESKERLVALAIRQHFQNYVEHQHFNHPPSSLRGVIERLIVSDISMRNMGEYVSAIVAIYFSQTAQGDLRIASSYNVYATLQPWMHALLEGGHLRRGLQPDVVVQDVVGLLFTISLEWCRGNIKDGDFIFKKLEGLLIWTSGATRGAGRKEVDSYLADVLGSRELYSRLESEVAPNLA